MITDFSFAYFLFILMPAAVIMALLGLLPLRITLTFRQILTFGRRIQELVRQDRETRIQLESLQHVKELLETVRAQRHNYSHDLQVIYGLLELGIHDEALSYIKNVLHEEQSTAELIKTDNIVLTALLQTKASHALANKVQFKVNVRTSLEELPLSAREASIILGNLIDNALDAVLKLEPEARKVEVILGRNMDYYFFAVKSFSSPISPEHMKRIFEPGFTTKLQGKGLGLVSSKKIIEKRQGMIKVISNGYCTSFVVLIPVRT